MRPFAAAVSDAGYKVSYAAVAGYESGGGGPEKIPAAYLAGVCRAFEVSPRWLLLGAGEMYDVEPGVKAQAYDTILEIIRKAEHKGGG